IEDNSVEMENMIKGSGWEGIVIASCPANHEFDGKSMAEILPGRYETGDMFMAFLDFMLEIDGEASMIAFAMDEADVTTVISHPLTSVVTDAWLTQVEAQERPHPRSYGSMPRLIRQYVIEDKVLSLEDAIRKMTSLPASVVGLPDRGLVREGFAADLVVFDPDTIRDVATFQVPNKYPEGIDYVIVNGAVTVDHGKHTGALNGRVLKKRR
ncbi:MAG TPA: amidohydrolase family protein, partial [Firmicutes bacterium]|nr:amidohydrolase family protein [Bacillota bacterium]